MKLNSIIIKCAFFIMICFGPSSSLAIMEGFSTEELTKASETVVMGDVEDVQSRWSEDGKTIFTSASIVITEFIKGAPTDQRITVEYEGGEIGDIGLRVSDVAPLTKGERVILFLQSGKSKRGIIYNMVGKAQGKYIIDKNGIARKRGFTIVNRAQIVDNDIPVETLIDKIRNVK